MIMLWQSAVAAASAWALAILFHAPPKQYLYSALAGAFSWLCYLLVLTLSGNEVASTFIATLTLTFLCRFLSVYRKAPVIIFLFPGIFPLVPGSSVYYTALSLMENRTTEALSFGMQTLAYTLAISLGILFAFSFFRDKKRSDSDNK